MRSYFNLFARYNQWANLRLYGAVESLSEDLLWMDKGAFFGSLGGTLNHLLVTDRMWSARLLGEPVPPLKLDSIVHRSLADLRQALEVEDQRILALVAGLDAARIGESLTFTNSAGLSVTQPIRVILGHIFNHQTHHRGQAHTLLGQLAGKPPELDFLYFMRVTQTAG
jgi:uncharacterized damage-inducible protein DinB